ncbi:MAG: alpha/beta hydrolase fold domain-containing protein [Planctomycetes bacterium]|nr:alpha/beta hydrolase fold domain-containing protein [Planctomycetota bacterium]
MTSTLLDSVVLEPKTTATATVIWMHGLGATGHDFPPVVGELGLPKGHGIRFIFPHAPSIPVTVNGGMVMPAWYDILAMDFDRRVDEEGVRKSADQIQALLERELEAGIPAQRIVLAGFSQGGAIALHLGLRYPKSLAGIMLLSTYMACDGNLDEERSPANAKTPVFQAHGTLDPMVLPGMGEAARDRMLALGYEVEWHTYPMEHNVVPEEISAIGIWLTKRLPKIDPSHEA